MKLAISNIAWSTSDDLKIYKLLNKYNFEGLEIAPTKFFPKNPYFKEKNKLKKLKEFICSKNLTLISMQSILYGKQDLVIFKDEETRNRMMNYLKKGILFAKELGIKNIVFGNPKNRISNSKNDFEIAINFFRELGEFAFKNNVVVGIEANPKIYGGNFLTTTSETIYFINKCRSKGIGLNLDIGTMIENNENLNVLEEISINKISHVHISEPYLELIKERNIHKKILEYLKKCNYKNYVSIEMRDCGDGTVEKIERVLKYISDLRKEVLNG